MNVHGILQRLILPIATGLLLALGFPPFNIGQAGWVALIPLLFALQDCKLGEAFRRGYLAGVVFFALTVWWTVHVSIAGCVALIAFLSLYLGVAAAFFVVLDKELTRIFAGVPLPVPAEPVGPVLASRLRKAAQRAQDTVSRGTTTVAESVTRNLLMAIIGSAGWVTLEWVRGKLLLGGFPWNFLGASQHQAAPLIQFVTVTGVYGVSALLCMVNFTFFFTIRRFVRQVRENVPWRRPSWEFYVAMILVCVAFLHGMREIRGAETAKTLRITLVQGNIPQTVKFEPEQKPVILDRYWKLTETAMATKPDLIIWPESATPEAMRYDEDSFALVTNVVRESKAYLLTGTYDFTPYPWPVEVTNWYGRVSTQWQVDAFNSAILVRPDGTLEDIYRKIHLVPFGEFVPFRKVLPFMKWFTPIADSFERGREFTVFEMAGPIHARFAVVICFEDTVPTLYRRFVQRHVSFMVNLTNDAWFKQSPAAEMHLANAVFRAIENRRPLVRATNSGVTCVVDQFGIVRTRLQPFVEGSLNTELVIPPVRELTFYTRYGDVFVGVCAAITGAAVLFIVVPYARRRQRG